jgi:hypothetical protein
MIISRKKQTVLGCFIIFKSSPETIIEGQDSCHICRPNPHSKFTSRAHATGSLQQECLWRTRICLFTPRHCTQDRGVLYPFNIAGILLLKQMSGNLWNIPYRNKSAIISMAINYCHKIYHFKDADGWLHSIG